MVPVNGELVGGEHLYEDIWLSELHGLEAGSVTMKLRPRRAEGNTDEAMLTDSLFRLARGNGAVALRAIQFILQCRYGSGPVSRQMQGKKAQEVAAQERSSGRRGKAGRDIQSLLWLSQ
jgi:hypothetical protein